MKSKGLIIGIVAGLLLVAGISLGFMFLKPKAPDKKVEETTFEFGKVNSVKEYTDNDIPDVTFYYYGDEPWTLNFKDLAFSTYNLTTSINGKEDTSNWLGIKVADYIEDLGEYFEKVTAYGANSIMSRHFDNLDNLYILINKNGKPIEFENNKSVYIIADITEDASNWFYNFESIKGID